jgi:hypothetical protein
VPVDSNVDSVDTGENIETTPRYASPNWWPKRLKFFIKHWKGNIESMR